MRGAFVDPGLLRHELSLQSAQLAADSLGGFSETWVVVATVFGRIEPVDARSFFGAAQRMEEATHEITIRYRTDVSSGMRFEKQGRGFLVMSVIDPDETGRYLICTTKEDGR